MAFKQVAMYNIWTTFPPVLYLCHVMLTVLHTKRLSPDVKFADKIFTNSTQNPRGDTPQASDV